jgi:hypothetical protein
MNKAEILQSLDAEIERLTQVRQLLTGNDGALPVASNGRRMSAEARARIAAAQRARWARVKAKKK